MAEQRARKTSALNCGTNRSYGSSWSDGVELRLFQLYRKVLTCFENKIQFSNSHSSAHQTNYSFLCRQMKHEAESHQRMLLEVFSW